MNGAAVEIAQRRVCHFKRKPNDEETGKRRLGCARCGKAKNDPDHFGAPQSLNVFGSGAQRAYQSLKQGWARILTAHLEASELPKGLAAVFVTGVATFPDRAARDQGNYRFIVEKALGDALVAGGWIEDDDWTRYRFGDLGYAYEKGVSETRLRLEPVAAEVPVGHQAELLAAGSAPL